MRLPVSFMILALLLSCTPNAQAKGSHARSGSRSISHKSTPVVKKQSAKAPAKKEESSNGIGSTIVGSAIGSAIGSVSGNAIYDALSSDEDKACEAKKD